MIVLAPCKINLGLHVVAKREDGYHSLETIFYPIPLTDEIEIQPSTADRLELKGISIEGRMEDNLVWRVVTLLRGEGFDIPPIHITLNKQIPHGAGLGGGSSDAACTLKALNEMFNLKLSIQKQEELVARLGADCPFFIQGKPVFAQGIGNEFSPISLHLKGWWLLLVKPNDHISTREAYSHIVPHKPLHNLIQLSTMPVNEWKGKMVNDFEASVFPTHPVVESIRDRMYQMGAAYASMSGSGSSVFGLFSAPIEDLTEFSSHFLFTCWL